jgi:hypothetical protein
MKLKKRIFFTTILFASNIISVLGHDFYQKTAMGYNKTSDYNHSGVEPEVGVSSKFSPSFEIGLGVKATNRLSLELMLHHINHKFNGAKYEKHSYLVVPAPNSWNTDVDIDAYVGLKNSIQTNAIFLNFKYDIIETEHNKVTPFAFAGVGVARNSSNDFIFDIHKERYVSNPTGENNKIIYPGINCWEKIDWEISARYYDYGKSTSEIGTYYNKTYDEQSGYLPKQTITGDKIGTKIRGFGASTGLIFKF